MTDFFELIVSITKSILSYRGFDRPLVGVSYIWVSILSILSVFTARKFLNISLFSIFIILVLPPLFGVYGGSVGFGTLLSSIIILSCLLQYSQINKFRVSLPMRFSTRFLNYIFILFLLITIHGYITYSLNIETFQIFRFLVSYIGMLFIIMSAYGVSYLLSTQNSKSFENIIKNVWILVLILTTLISIRFAFFSPLYRHPYGELAIFSEPTFYAVTCLPFFVYKLATSSHIKQLQILIAMIAMGFIIRSTTLLIATALIYFSLKLRVSKKIFYFLTSVLTIFIIYIINLEIIGAVHSPYCENCLFDGSANPIFHVFYRIQDLFNGVNIDTNLSILFYKKEWHEAFNNLINTNGLGIGFQQTGIHGFSSFIADIIHQKHPSLQFDSLASVSIAAKLISEFGVIGIGFLLLYLKYFIKSFSFVRHTIQQGSNKISNIELLLHSFNLTYFILLFIRGYGYFSSSLFFLIMFIAYFFIIKKNLSLVSESR